MSTLKKSLSFQHKNLESQPDVLLIDGQFSLPHPDFVISRNDDGSVLSRFGDALFDLSPYATRDHEPSKFDFDGYIHADYIAQAKHLFIIIYYFGQGRSGVGLSVSTLKKSFSNFINPLCTFAAQNDVTAYEVLANQHRLEEFTQYIIKTNRTLQDLSSAISILHSAGQDNTGIKCDISTRLKKAINTIVKESQRKLKQHPVIPGELYLNVIKQAWNVINDFITHKGQLAQTAHQWKAIQDARLADLGNGQKKRTKTFLQVAEENRLNLFFDKYNATSLSAYFTGVQATGKLLIHAYSGMRRSEALSLKYNCLEIAPNRNKARFIGDSSKYSGIKKSTKWVTTSEIESVIEVLQTICQIISRYLDIDPEKENCPLFLTTGYMRGINVDIQNLRPATPAKMVLSNAYILDPDKLVIKKEHLQELIRIDPTRNWASEEKYSPGAKWHFTSHQFRRSLAVYAAQSGLVTIGAMKVQFQHLFREMTYYYQNGCSEANKLFKVPELHVGNDYNKSKPFADAIAYIYDVLLSNEELHGARGSSLENLRGQNNTDHKILENRSNTIDMFKNGQLAYAETPFGGCGKLGTCTDRLQRSITACVSCSEAIIKESKLDLVIAKQKSFLANTSNEFERRISLDEISELEKFKTTITKKGQEQ